MFGKLVPVPSGAVIPERDIGKRPILNCINLGVTFGGLKAVDDFNLMIGRTEIAGLIGPNGAGKTTVFNLLTKVYQPTHGTILLDGQDTHNMTTAQVNRAGIARTFQNIRLFNDLTVEENVTVAMDAQMKYSMVSGIFRLPSFWKEEKVAHERALELLCSICRIWQMSRPVPCPTAPSAVWRLSGRWQPTPPCCCWMSPPLV